MYCGDVVRDGRPVTGSTVAVCCSVLQCVAVFHSVLQCVAVCCSVLQCDAVTLFVVDALLQVARLLITMSFLFHASGGGRDLRGVGQGGAGEGVEAVRAASGRWYLLQEYVLYMLMVSSTITQLVHLGMEGLTAHCAVLWNWSEAAVVCCFWLGVGCGMLGQPLLGQPLYPLSSADARPGGGHRFEAPENASFGHDSSAQSAHEPLVHPGFSAGAAAAAGKEGEIWFGGDGLENLFYSLSLFFMWTSSYSIMSIHKDLGPLVIIIRRMAFDMLNFAVVWMVLLMAFSCLLQGADLLHPPSAPTSTNSTNTFKEEGGEGARGHYMGDWSSWWIWRTYYQAMGQPFFDEMPSGYSNAATIFMWPIMNVMMVNLLVAMMSDTYAQVKNHSRLEWMIEMLHTARRYRSPSRLNVVLLLRDMCNFLVQRRHINRIMSEYMSEGHEGIPHLSVHRDVAAPLRGWRETRLFLRQYWKDLCFKFYKFECRDLPRVDLAFELQHLKTGLAKVLLQLSPNHMCAGTHSYVICDVSYLFERVRVDYEICDL